MKALTIWQPWASLIAHDIKSYETRAWRPPESVIGERIAIHAGRTDRGLDTYASTCHLDHATCERTAALTRLVQHGCNLYNLPRGSIIATATIAFALATDGDLARDILPTERALGDWGPHRWAWRLTDHHVLKHPIPCAGSQGLWDVPASITLPLPGSELWCRNCGAVITEDDPAYANRFDDDMGIAYSLCPTCAATATTAAPDCPHGTCQSEITGAPCGTCLGKRAP